MLNYRNTVILFLIVLAGLILTDLVLPVHPVWYIGMGIVFLLMLTAGSVYIRLGFYINAYCAGDGKEKRVALSFDDGPDPVNTPAVLNILKQQGIQAAFFVVGNKLEDNRELIRRMDEEGHILGGHSYSHHFFFDLFTAQRMKTELKKSEEIVLKITGKKMKLFRPPYGVTNPVLARVIRKLGYLVIGWSLKSGDTVAGDSQVLLAGLQKEVKSGDILLFHDTKPVLLQILPSFITFLKSEKYQIVRPDQLLNLEAYE
jgi:peptidoglycan/xylan/chitin deacetylase (PgdA/CDA1 family)